MKSHRFRKGFAELSELVRKVVDFEAGAAARNWNPTTFEEDGVRVELAKDGMITTTVDNPLVMLLRSTQAGITTMHVLRADGYAPIAREPYLDAALEVLRRRVDGTEG